MLLIKISPTDNTYFFFKRFRLSGSFSCPRPKKQALFTVNTLNNTNIFEKHTRQIFVILLFIDSTSFLTA